MEDEKNKNAENTNTEKPDTGNLGIDYEFPLRPQHINAKKTGLSKTAKTVYAVIGAVLLIFIAVLAYRIAAYYIDLNNNRRIAELARQIAANTPTPTPVKTATPAPTPTPTPTPTPAPSKTPEPTPAPTPEPIMELDEEPERVMLDFIAELRTAFNNDDIVGYLEIEGTNVAYAVVRADDNEFYLTRDITKTAANSGSIFMDYENDPENLDRNTVLYGHNMRDGSMFHNLRYYREQSFFEEHRFINYTTLYETTKWEVFSVYDAYITFNYIQVRFEDEEEFLTMANKMKEKSVFDTGVTVGPGDKILTLSTCTNTTVITRFAVSAKLIGAEPDE